MVSKDKRIEVIDLFRNKNLDIVQVSEQLDISIKIVVKILDSWEKLNKFIDNITEMEHKNISYPLWINDFNVLLTRYIQVKLNNTNIDVYINNKRISQCKYLFFNISVDKIKEYDYIQSIDDMDDNFNNSNETNKNLLDKQTEFIGHVSNLQVWIENDYNTEILHRTIAFPLLKELSFCSREFRVKFYKELEYRFESNNRNVQIAIINSLINEKSKGIDIFTFLMRYKTDIIQNNLMMDINERLHRFPHIFDIDFSLIKEFCYSEFGKACFINDVVVDLETFEVLRFVKACLRYPFVNKKGLINTILKMESEIFDSNLMKQLKDLYMRL